jgi:regulator of sirC expression with transglutaminase-like and TPR domain
MSNDAWSEYLRSKELSLDRGMFMIAKVLQHPSLDIERELKVLDSMAQDIKSLLQGRQRPTEIINMINEYLFEKHGFNGNTEDYYDPRNSYLNDVIERKTGIPITLSALYMELARRIGLILHGVGFPGHLLVKHLYHDVAIVIDPFNKGRILSTEDCQRLLDRLYSGQVRFEPRFLESVTNEQMLIRMLRNLKEAYMHSYDYDKALSATEMIITMNSNLAEEFRDRGLIFYRKNLYGDALTNLTRYLEMRPDAEDADSIIQLVRDIQSLFKHDMYR